MTALTRAGQLHDALTAMRPRPASRVYFDDLDHERRRRVLTKTQRLYSKLDIWSDDELAKRSCSNPRGLRGRMFRAVTRLDGYIAGAGDVRVPWNREEYDARLVGCNGHDGCHDCRDVRSEV